MVRNRRWSRYQTFHFTFRHTLRTDNFALITATAFSPLVPPLALFDTDGNGAVNSGPLIGATQLWIADAPASANYAWISVRLTPPAKCASTQSRLSTFCFAACLATHTRLRSPLPCQVIFTSQPETPAIRWDGTSAYTMSLPLAVVSTCRHRSCDRAL